MSVDKNIGRFDIAMRVAVRMQECNGVDQLAGVLASVAFRQWAITDDIEQLEAGHQVHYEKQFLGGLDRLYEFDDMRVTHAMHDDRLSSRILVHIELFQSALVHDFHRILLARAVIDADDDAREHAIAQLAGEAIAADFGQRHVAIEHRGERQ